MRWTECRQCNVSVSEKPATAWPSIVSITLNVPIRTLDDFTSDLYIIGVDCGAGPCILADFALPLIARQSYYLFQQYSSEVLLKDWVKPKKSTAITKVVMMHDHVSRSIWTLT